MGHRYLRYIPLNSGCLVSCIHFFQNGFLRSRSDKFALMRRDRTETATTEASSVHIDGKFDHLIRRNSASFIVFGMRQSGIWQVKRIIHFLFCHRFKRRIDDQRFAHYVLCDSIGLPFIGFHFYNFEVGSILDFILKTYLVTDQFDSIPLFGSRDICRSDKKSD
jgi:hypothetical protein